MIQLEIMSPQRFQIPGASENGGDFKRTVNLLSYQKAGVHYNLEFLTQVDYKRFSDFFDEVRKRNSQTMGMFNFRFIDTDTWAQTTLIESDGNLKARFTDYGRGGKMQGKYEEI